MKKLLLIGAIVVSSLVAMVVAKKVFNKSVTIQTAEQMGDLIIVNDLSDAISTEYKTNGKDSGQVLKPGDLGTGGKGFMRIFTAKKAGSYELTYQFPRPSGSAQRVSVSQIIGAAKTENFGDEVITRKGMLGDIKVGYEEARDLESTY